MTLEPVSTNNGQKRCKKESMLYRARRVDPWPSAGWRASSPADSWLAPTPRLHQQPTSQTSMPDTEIPNTKMMLETRLKIFLFSANPSHRSLLFLLPDLFFFFFHGFPGLFSDTSEHICFFIFSVFHFLVFFYSVR